VRDPVFFRFDSSSDCGQLESVTRDITMSAVARDLLSEEAEDEMLYELGFVDF
jgi:hypothetical protein